MPIYLFAALFTAVGLALLILPSRVTAAFDRPSHTLVITRRSLRATTREEVDFSRITGVEAERSSDASARFRTRSPSTTWRVAIVLRDGTRLPVTAYYSNSRSHATAAAAARDFLSLPAAPESFADPIDPAQLQRTQAKLRRSAKLFVAFGLIFVAFGGWMTYVQYSRLLTYRPVPAVVLFSTVISHRGSKGGTSYSPSVTYRYTVADREHVSTHATILDESRTGSWAQRIASRFHPGDTVQAWFDPAHPDRSYLVHEPSAFPLIFSSFAVAICSIALFFIRRASRQATAFRTDADTGGCSAGIRSPRQPVGVVGVNNKPPHPPRDPHALYDPRSSCPPNEAGPAFAGPARSF